MERDDGRRHHLRAATDCPIVCPPTVCRDGPDHDCRHGIAYWTPCVFLVSGVSFSCAGPKVRKESNLSGSGRGPEGSESALCSRWLATRRIPISRSVDYRSAKSWRAYVQCDLIATGITEGHDSS